MTRANLTAASAVLLLTLVACAAKDIEASDYDQTCGRDDDCVAVSELHAEGGDCAMGCGAQAINKKDLATYQEDLDTSRGRCGSMRSPFCEEHGSPACVDGRCTIKQ
jgi:hypothetical protein